MAKKPSEVLMITYQWEDLFPDCVLPDCPLSHKTHQHILPHQKEIMEDKDYDILYCQGGVGSAKSIAVAAKVVDLSLSVPKNSGVVGREDLLLLYKSTWKDVKDCLERLVEKGIIDEPKYESKRQGDYSKITIRENGSILYAFHTKKWTEGLGSSYGWFLIDDAMETSEIMFAGDETNSGLIARLRTPHVRYYKTPQGVKNKLKGLIISNPPPSNHWLHKMFGKEPGLHDLGPLKVKHMQVATASNPFVGPEYAAGLMAVQKKMGRSESTAQRIIYGRSMPAYGGVKVYPQFDHLKHVGSFKFDPNKALVRSWDFGFHHPAVIFANLWLCEEKEWHFTTLHEIADVFSSDVWQLRTRVIQDTALFFANHNEIYDCGDRAGYRRDDANKDARGPIRILQAEYGMVFKFCRLDLNNSLESVRGLLKKKCLCSQPILLINNSCQVLIEALEGGYKYTKARGTGKISDKPLKDKYYDDLADAWRYGIENFVRFGLPYAYNHKVSTGYKKQSKPWDWMDVTPQELVKLLI